MMYVRGGLEIGLEKRSQYHQTKRDAQSIWRHVLLLPAGDTGWHDKVMVFSLSLDNPGNVMLSKAKHPAAKRRDPSVAGKRSFRVT